MLCELQHSAPVSPSRQATGQTARMLPRSVHGDCGPLAHDNVTSAEADGLYRTFGCLLSEI
jgi:hypothetical protein